MRKHPQAIFCQTKVWSPCPFGVQATCFGKMHTEYLWSVHLFIVCQMFESNCEYHNVLEFGPVETGGRQGSILRQLLESYWHTARVHPILHTSIVAVDDV